MATIATKETRMFDWRNPGVLKVGDEITETLEDGREAVSYTHLTLPTKA